ncbi:ArsA family ATPase [Halarchaeum sp. P4]|uniref:ArsA family ATPase n=1 Tax=Halarchaeum sp. P4 TaxID=3421639 RepID=UPI003EB99282
MSELEVEAVDEIESTGVAPGTADYVLYGGKGGVGKTTMAAATGLASAREGTPTLVVSTDPAHSLSDTYEVDVPSQPSRLREDVPLWGVEIDPDEAMERASALGFGGAGADGEGAGAGPMGGLGDLLGGEGANPFGGPMPGADEAAAMQLLIEYLDDERFERVVVDTAPTGHTLRLLELPELMDSMMGRMLQFREKMSGMMDSLTGMFGGGEEDDQMGMGDMEEVRERVEHLRSVLTDPAKTDFRIVTVPEEMSVVEAKRLRARLDEFGIPVNTVVVNKVMEPLVDVVPDIPADTFVSPNLEECEFCQRRWDVQQDALAEAQELFRGHDVKRVPLLAEEVRGEDALRVVAACLSR